jgi:hypothetical protein
MGFYHNVYFKLKSDLNTEQRRAFQQGLRDLIEKIEFVLSGEIAIPAPIDREVVVKDYDFALLVLFGDKADHDAYQVHAVHKAFLEQFRSYWEKVTIYDSIVIPTENDLKS